MRLPLTIVVLLAALALTGVALVGAPEDRPAPPQPPAVVVEADVRISGVPVGRVDAAGDVDSVAPPRLDQRSCPRRAVCGQTYVELTPRGR